MPAKVLSIGHVGLRESEEGGVRELAALGKYADEIVKVVSSERHAVVLLKTGQVIVWGDSSEGRLGLEGKLPPTVDRPMMCNIDTVVDVACGDAHSIAVTSSGVAFAWGRNQHGQLGLGSLASQATPTAVPPAALPPFVAVACGAAHSVFLSERGHVYVCGRGVEGQLGAGAAVQFHTSPRIVSSVSPFNIVSIAAGANVLMLTTSDGAVLSCGEGGTGSTAQGTSKTKRVPEKVFAPHQEATPEAAKAVEIPRYGTLESYQTSRLTKRLPAVNHEAAFTTVSVGWGHSLFLDASGRVFSSGLNTKGQLGVGLTKLTKFTTLQEVKVEAAYSDSSTSLAARKAPIGAEVLYEGNPGTVVGCARGRVGVLMEGEESKGPIGVPPVEVQVVRRPEEQPPDTLFVDDIACGATFSAALSGGVLYLWGQLPTDAPAGSEELLHPRVLGGWVPTLAPFSLFSDAFGAGEGDDGIRVRRAFHVCNRLLLVVDRVSDSPENSPGQPADLASEPEEA